MKCVYVKTELGRKKKTITRTVNLGNGVCIDVNDSYGIIGVEIVNAKDVAINDV